MSNNPARIGLAFAMVALVSTAVGADTLKECKLSSGKILSCPSGGYSGSAVVEKDGKYKECKLSSGKILSCPSGGFSGSAVVPK